MVSTEVVPDVKSHTCFKGTVQPKKKNVYAVTMKTETFKF